MECTKSFSLPFRMFFDAMTTFEDFPPLEKVPEMITFDASSSVYIDQVNFVPQHMRCVRDDSNWVEDRDVVVQSYSQLCPVGKCPAKLKRAKHFVEKREAKNKVKLYDSKGREVRRSPSLRPPAPWRAVAIPKPQKRVYDLGRFHDISLSSSALISARDVFNGKILRSKSGLSRSQYRKSVQELIRLESLERDGTTLSAPCGDFATCQGFAPDFKVTARIDPNQLDAVKQVVSDVSTKIESSTRKASGRLDSILTEVENLLKQFNMDFDSMTVKAIKALAFLACAVIILVKAPDLWPAIVGMCVLYFNVGEIVVKAAAHLIAKLTASGKEEIPSKPAQQEVPLVKRPRTSSFAADFFAAGTGGLELSSGESFEMRKARDPDLFTAQPNRENMSKDEDDDSVASTGRIRDAIDRACEESEGIGVTPILMITPKEEEARNLERAYREFYLKFGRMPRPDEDVIEALKPPKVVVEGEAKTQADVLDVATSVSALASIFCSLTGAHYATDYMPSKETVGEVTRLLNAGNSLERASSNLSSLFKIIFKACYSMITGKEWLSTPAQILLEKISDWMDETQKFMETSGKSIQKEINLLSILTSKLKQGQALHKEMLGMKLDGYSFTPFITYLGTLEKLQLEAERTHNVKQREARPVWVYLVGGSRVGKTVFAQLLTKHIAARRDIPYNKDTMYSRQFTNKQHFWDGYENQVCTTIDDLLQQTNQDLIADQIMDVLYMCNEYQYQVNMANLEDKGRKFFSSKMLVTTSNRMAISDITSVVSKEAFQLRRDFVVRMRLKPEFCPPGTTPSWHEIKRRTGVKCPKHVWLFDLLPKQFDTASGSVESQIISTLTFEEMLEAVDQAITRYETTDNTMQMVIDDPPITRDQTKNLVIPMCSPVNNIRQLYVGAGGDFRQVDEAVARYRAQTGGSSSDDDEESCDMGSHDGTGIIETQMESVQGDIPPTLWFEWLRRYTPSLKLKSSDVDWVWGTCLHFRNTDTGVDDNFEFPTGLDEIVPDITNRHYTGLMKKFMEESLKTARQLCLPYDGTNVFSINLQPMVHEIYARWRALCQMGNTEYIPQELKTWMGHFDMPPSLNCSCHSFLIQHTAGDALVRSMCLVILKYVMLENYWNTALCCSMYHEESQRLYYCDSIGRWVRAVEGTFAEFRTFRDNLTQGARFSLYRWMYNCFITFKHRKVVVFKLDHPTNPSGYANGANIYEVKEPAFRECSAQVLGLGGYYWPGWKGAAAQTLGYCGGVVSLMGSVYMALTGIGEIWSGFSYSLKLLRICNFRYKSLGPLGMFYNTVSTFIKNYGWLRHLLLGVGALAIAFVLYKYITKPCMNLYARCDLDMVKKAHDEAIQVGEDHIFITVENDEIAFVQAMNSGDFTTKKHAKIKRPTPVQPARLRDPRIAHLSNAITQSAQKGGPDPNFNDILINVLWQHFVKICWLEVNEKGERTVVSKMHGLFTNMRSLLCPKHFFAVKHPMIRLVFMNGHEVDFPFDEKMVTQWENTDVATLECPSQVAPKTSILKHFPKLSEAGGNVNMVKLITFNEIYEHATRLIMFDMRDVSKFSPNATYTAKDAAGIAYQVVNGFFGDVLTSEGDCGGVYVAYDAHVPRKLLGFHTAYHTTKGMACGTWLTQERIIEHQRPPNPKDSKPVEVEGVVKTQCLTQNIYWDDDIKRHLNVLGPVERGRAQLMPTVSKIVPSLVHGELTSPISHPALLTLTELPTGEVIDPNKNALRKWARPPHYIPPDAREILDDVLQNLPFEWGLANDDFQNVESLDVAMNGKPGTPMEPIEDKTSAGKPFTEMKHSLGGKKDHMINVAAEGEPRKYEASTFLKDRLKMREEMAKQGLRFDTRWGDCLKDERRPWEKIYAGSTRLFCVGPLDYTILCRKYFMRFAAHCINERYRLPMKIGINPDGSEWRTFWFRLNRRQRRAMVKFIAGDFSNFDMSLLTVLTEGVGEAIIRWFELHGATEEETTVRRTLLQEIYRSVRVNGSYIYECQQGVPSGHFLTALFNSIVNYVIIKTCIFYVARQRGIEMTHEIFAELWECGMVGDDHVIGQDEDVDWFDQQVLQRTIKHIFGMGYTDSTKSAVVAPFTNREDLTFLKRYFREVDGFVFAPLMKEVLEEEINWIRKNDDGPVLSTWKNLDASLRGYMHWGKEIFEERKEVYNRLVFKHQLGPPFRLTFEALLEEWKHR
jgi:hypothetical protein